MTSIVWMNAEQHQPPEDSLLLVVEDREGGRVGDIVAGFYADGEYHLGTTMAGDPLQSDQVVRFWAKPNWPEGYNTAGCWDDVPSAGEQAPRAVPVTLQLSEDVYTNLLTVVKNCNLSHQERDGANTHGQLDVPRLLAMLAEDAAMTNSRPGSWEGSNMQQVLDSHGYQ